MLSILHKLLGSIHTLLVKLIKIIQGNQLEKGKKIDEW